MCIGGREGFSFRIVCAYLALGWNLHVNFVFHSFHMWSNVSRLSRRTQSCPTFFFLIICYFLKSIMENFSFQWITHSDIQSHRIRRGLIFSGHDGIKIWIWTVTKAAGHTIFSNMFTILQLVQLNVLIKCHQSVLFLNYWYIHAVTRSQCRVLSWLVLFNNLIDIWNRLDDWIKLTLTFRLCPWFMSWWHWVCLINPLWLPSSEASWGGQVQR